MRSSQCRKEGSSMHRALKTWLQSELAADEAEMKVPSLHFDLQGVGAGAEQRQ